jgi:hypothetical protein
MPFEHRVFSGNGALEACETQSVMAVDRCQPLHNRSYSCDSRPLVLSLLVVARCR